MKNAHGKRRVTVTLDADLLDFVDCLVKNRSAAIEEALRLWRVQQIDRQLLTFYQNRSTQDLQAEADWARTTQDAALQAWENEGTWLTAEWERS